MKVKNGFKIGASHIDEIGENHIGTSSATPIRDDAFELCNDTKKAKIEEHFEAIMNILGLDLKDDSLKGTPKRVAKMFVNEIFSGLSPENKPSATLFKNKYQYRQMLVEKTSGFNQLVNTIFYRYTEGHISLTFHIRK